MAGSLNSVQLIGNLGRDPEVRTMQSGSKVANLRIATSESWTKDGERQERTEWHSVVIWGKLAEIAERFCRKGSKVYVRGQLQTRKWTDAAGAERYSTETVLQGFGSELILLDGKGERAADGPAQPASSSAKPGAIDDDIPF